MARAYDVYTSPIHQGYNFHPGVQQEKQPVVLGGDLRGRDVLKKVIGK